MKNEKEIKIEELENEANKLRDDAYNILLEYLDDLCKFEDMKESLEKIKKRYLDSWVEASELM